MEYSPENGFYDLSEKPATLTEKEHEKVQKLQLWLREMNGKKQSEHNWELLKETSAKLQFVIFEHYEPDREFKSKQLSLF